LDPSGDRATGRDSQDRSLRLGFSYAEILSTLYYDVLRLGRGDPSWADRDRFLLGKGHAAIGLCPILADLDFFPVNLLDSYTRLGNPLGDPPDHQRLGGLVAIIDRNEFCLDGRVEDVVSIEPLAEKWAAFGSCSQFRWCHRSPLSGVPCPHQRSIPILEGHPARWAGQVSLDCAFGVRQFQQRRCKIGIEEHLGRVPTR
jgi:Transketolase, thiamine diphosphate binding domain